VSRAGRPFDRRIVEGPIPGAVVRAYPDVESLINKKDGTFSSELSLLHTFELGGKRRARKLLAQAQLSSAETDLLAAKENAIKTGFGAWARANKVPFAQATAHGRCPRTSRQRLAAKARSAYSCAKAHKG